MLSTEDFKAFAKEVVPFCHITTHLEGRKDEDLLGRKGGGGFPYLVSMDAEGHVTAVLEGDRTVEGLREMVAKGKEYLGKKARKDLPVADAADLLLFDIGVGNVTLEEARAALAGMKDLPAEKRKEVEAAVNDRRIQDVLGAIKTGTPAERVAAGKEFAAMWKEGVEPDGAGQPGQAFYILMLDFAESGKDAALFEKALSTLKKALADNPRAQPFFEKQDERLEKLKGGAGSAPEAPGGK